MSQEDDILRSAEEVAAAAEFEQNRDVRVSLDADTAMYLGGIVVLDLLQAKSANNTGNASLAHSDSIPNTVKEKMDAVLLPRYAEYMDRGPFRVEFDFNAGEVDYFNEKLLGRIQFGNEPIPPFIPEEMVEAAKRLNRMIGNEAFDAFGKLNQAFMSGGGKPRPEFIKFQQGKQGDIPSF